jgi:biopolymer transport protein ExbD
MQFRKETEIKKPLSVFTLASLTDIVLLLLIFFLLTSSFVANFGIRVNVPRSESSPPVQQQFITVVITPDGTFYVNGDLTTKSDLATRVRSEHQNNPGTPLVIRADKDAIIDDAVHVMNIGQSLNMSILMATERAFR